jgi:VCBS repeat-containing protein
VSRRALQLEQLEPRMLLAGELMEYRIQLFQAGTNNPLGSTIPKGTDFDMAVMVKDLRGPGSTSLIGDRGVFSGFVDVLYNKSLASVEIEEVQRINIVGNPSGGNFTLTFNDGSVSRTTGSIAYNPAATPVQMATVIQNALSALSNIGAGNVEVIPVSNLSTASFRVRFQGKLGDKNLPLMFSDEPAVVQINQADAIDGGTPTPANFVTALRRHRIVSGQLEEYYTNQKLGSDQSSPGRIDDAGGVVNVFNFPDPEDGQRLLFRVRMNTLNAGVLSFTGSVADIGLGNETTLFGSGGGADDPLVPSQILIVNSPTVTITEPFSANPDAFTVNEDSGATTLNVTSNDRKNNPDAALPAGIVIVNVTQGSQGGTVTINTGAKTVNYTPVGNTVGTETFTYTLRDPTTLVTDTTTVTVTLSPVNDAPVNTVPGVQSIVEEGTRTFSTATSNRISIADIDAGGAIVETTLTVNSGKLTLSGTMGLTFISGANGTATMKIRGTLASINSALNGMQYAPNLHFNGSDTLQIVTSDLNNTGSGGAKTDTDTVTINVSAVNDAPEVTVPGAQSATELIPLTLPAILVGDVDVTGTNLQVTLSVNGGGKLQLAAITGLTFVSGANNTGSMSFKGTPANINAALAAVVYTAAPGDAGLRTLTVLASDNGSSGTGGTLTDQETVQINVAALERPYAVDDAYTFSEGSSSNLMAVLTNDIPDDLNTKVLVDYTQPSHGSLTDNGDGTLSYTPDPDFFGTDTFTYRLNQTPDALPLAELDGDQTATVTITVTNVADAPVAGDDSASTNEDTAIDIGVMADDVDVDLGVPPASQTPTSATHTVVIVDPPDHGTATVNANGTVRYMPAQNYNGPDSFIYRLNDGTLNSNNATVDITVNPVNDAPAAVNNSYATNQNTQLVVGAPGVLGNDTDVDGPSLTVNGVTQSPTKGSLNLASDGSFTYTPNTNVTGTDTFKYRATDGSLLSNEVTVTIRINANPNAVNDGFTSIANVSNQSHTVLTNDTIAPDVGETLTITGAGFGASSGTTQNGGTVVIAADGKSVRYTPAASFTGTDSYSYTISDGNGGSDTATVTVNVIAPVATDITGVVYIDSDNDNVIDAGERRLAGVEITLQGSDFLGTPVNVTVQTDINGGYLVPAVMPGSYTVRELAPEHLRDGKDKYNTTALGSDSVVIIKSTGNDFFTIQLPIFGTQSPTHTLPNNNFGELGFVANYIKSTAMSAYTSANHIWLDILTNNTQLWQSKKSGWDNLKSASFNWTTKTLTAVDMAGNVFSRVLGGPSTPLPRFRVVGTNGTNARLIRIEGSAANFGWTLMPFGAPRGVADNYSTNEDQTLNVASAINGVLGNDIDPNNPNLTASLVSNVSHGSLILNANGTFTYTPTGNYNGPDSFTYRASDGVLNSLPTTVNITVNPVNDDPTANPDTLTAIKNLPSQTHNVLANDSIAPDAGETLTITAAGVSGATQQGGTVAIAPDGKSVRYTPPSGYTGPDSYSYTISDGHGGTDTATVAVNVIDAVPTDISGTVWFDADRDVVVDATERRVAGIDIQVQGTDIGGTPVNFTVKTDINGFYLINDLAPGSYTIRELHSKYHRDGTDKYNTTARDANNALIIKTTGNDFFTIVIPAGGTLDPSHTLPNNNFSEWGLNSTYVNSTAFGAYTGTTSILMGVGGTNTQLWQVRYDGWNNLKTASFNMSTKTLTVTDMAGTVFTRVLGTSGAVPRYRIVGADGTLASLVRIEGSAANFGWNLQPAPEGEGEFDDFASDVDQLMSGL